jgi:hypothetical protein
MWSVLLLMGLLCGETQASDWKEQEIDPKVLTDVTAFTVGKGRYHVGAFRQGVGILDNASVSTNTLLIGLQVPNVSAKVTAIQTDRIDASLEGGRYQVNPGLVGLPGREMTVTPVSTRVSWTINPKWGLHLGWTWTNVKLSGEMSGAEIAAAISSSTGADIGAGLLDGMGDQQGLTAGADLTLLRTNFAADFRLNRRDSIILTNTTTVFLRALIAGGVVSTDAAGNETEVGASARFTIPMSSTVPEVSTLSWQWSWERLHLRVGIPLSGPETVLLALPRAFSAYWVLGPREKKRGRG